MGSPNSGLLAFSEAWVDVSTTLVRNKRLSDVERTTTKSPPPFKAAKGHYRKIAQVETGGLFVTVARRALADKHHVFDRTTLTRPYAEAELAVQGLGLSDLTPSEREREFKRVGTAISRDMQCLVFFGLFEERKGTSFYALTPLGEAHYARLDKDDDAPGDHLLDPSDASR